MLPYRVIRPQWYNVCHFESHHTKKCQIFSYIFFLVHGHETECHCLLFMNALPEVCCPKKCSITTNVSTTNANNHIWPGWHMTSYEHPWGPFRYLTGEGISIINIRWSHDCWILIVEIANLERWFLLWNRLEIISLPKQMTLIPLFHQPGNGYNTICVAASRKTIALYMFSIIPRWPAQYQHRQDILRISLLSSSCFYLTSIFFWWWVNIGSGNDLVPSRGKPLPEALLTQI